MTNNIPTQNTDYSLEQMDGEILLYSPVRTKTIYLNQTASMIWRLCDGKRSISDIVEILTDAFPDAENITEDITLCIDQLSGDDALSVHESN